MRVSKVRKIFKNINTYSKVILAFKAKNIDSVVVRVGAG